MAKRQPWARVRLVLRRIRSHNNFDYDHKYYYDYYYNYVYNYDDDGAGDYDDSGANDYNGGRKGYYNPAANYDYLYDSGSTASPTASASRANND